MKTLLLSFLALIVCASVQDTLLTRAKNLTSQERHLVRMVPHVGYNAINWKNLRPVITRVPEQPITGEQYDARIKSMKRYGDASPRIVGGQEATLGQFPYQAAVNIDAGYFCGGSLISKDYVLTAGHCGVLGNSFTIYLGAIHLKEDDPTRVIVRSTEPHVHEEYNPDTLYGDLCLLKLEESVQPNNDISMVSLPPISSNPPLYTNAAVTVSGWGKTSDSSSGVSPILEYTSLVIISNDECEQTYGSIISTSQICAGGDPNHSTCNGDSGGPLTTDIDRTPTQIGIVSFVSSAGCESGSPTGYTRISTFREWISKNANI